MSVYSDQVRSLWPQAYYRLNDQAAAVMADNTPKARHGIYQGAVTLGAPSLLVTDLDAAATFAGGRGQLTAGVPYLTDTFSLEAWFNTPTPAATMTVISLGQNAGALTVVGGQLRGERSNQAAVVTSGAVAIAANTVYHAVFTKTGATRALYLNGVDVGALAANQTCTVGAVILVGTGVTGTGTIGANPFAGTIDEVAVYDYALSAAQVAANYRAGTVVPAPPGPAGCVRQAWLTLGPNTMALEDETAGYYCTELDLGYPEVRDVVNNRPDQNGVDDRTLLWGSRAISADIVCQGAPGFTVDALAAQFAPYMIPAARPVLHYVLDRPGTPERTIGVRAADYKWPISGKSTRAVQLSWVAADPLAYGAVTNTATAWAGSSTIAGRTYNLTFDRTYPAGGSAPTTAILTLAGDVAVRPLIRVYGPITAANLNGSGGSSTTGDLYSWTFQFVAGFVIDAGHWVDIDSAARTVTRDSNPTQAVYNQVNWWASTWPYYRPGTGYLNVAGGSTTGVTQAQAIWKDAYLE
jgi:hypothetical protein